VSHPRNTARKSERSVIREVLFQQQGGRCAHCECAMTLKRRGGRNSTAPTPRNLATLDHKVARSLGGTDAVDNLVVACHRCNNRKSADEYREHQRVLGYRL